MTVKSCLAQAYRLLGYTDAVGSALQKQAVGLVDQIAAELWYAENNNPAKDVLKIELNTNIIVGAEQLQMSVYDSYGRCLTTKAFDGELDVSGFKGGVYLLRVVDGERGQLYSAKFIVAK